LTCFYYHPYFIPAEFSSRHPKREYRDRKDGSKLT